MNIANNKIAILVDGDNAQAKLLKPILEEVSKYGKVTIRRIYGDWTNQHMNSWKEVLNDLSFNPIQKFSYTTGKNSTDSSLIIDAMDILHDKIVDGFCIVSSDSDYTGLAKRIREDGIFVMGIGEKKTPNAFIQSCEVFTYCENIVPFIPEENPEAMRNVEPVRPKKKGRRKSQKNQGLDNELNNTNVEGNEKVKTEKIEIVVIKPKLLRSEANLINKAYEMAVNEGTETLIAQVGVCLRKISPSFDSRAFGFKTLTQLFESLPKYEVIKNQINGMNQPLVRKK